MIEAIMMTLISNLFETLGLMISTDKGCFIKVPRAMAVRGSAVQFGIFQGWARRWSGGRWVSGCGGWPLCDYISQVPSPPVWNNVINGTTLSATDTTPAPGGLRFQTPQTFSQRLQLNQDSFPSIFLVIYANTATVHTSVRSGVMVKSVAFLNQFSVSKHALSLFDAPLTIFEK